MKASDVLLSLEWHNLSVKKIHSSNGREEIAVEYEHCEIKDDAVLVGAFGTGYDFEQACEDYLNKIRGKTLVFNACSDNRKEVTVLG